MFVLDNHKQPLMPCVPARARQLLKKGKASVYRRFPFTIILNERVAGSTQPTELKYDPGSKTTGISLIVHGKTASRVVWAGELTHRSWNIVEALNTRRNVRKFRRYRKTRYRQPRFLNRTRKDKWLPPSIQSRVDNIVTITRKLQVFAPLSSLACEVVKFDTQKLRNPEIDGAEYQRGTLFGFELWEYLLVKWNHSCAYCNAKNTPLEKEHVVAKSKGGSNSVTNLVVSCRPCNERKGTKSIDEFLKKKPSVLKKIKSQLKAPLKDAASMNANRYAIARELETFNLPVNYGTGGQTKYNRTNQGYRKEHWIDASCATSTGENIQILDTMTPLIIKAVGRGSRKMCQTDGYGFPSSKPKAVKRINGFQTNDIVKAIVTKGKKKGVYVGKVSIRSTGYFNIKTKQGKIQGINHRYCNLLQRIDGYEYHT